MSRRGRFGRRSITEWSFRGLVAALAVAVGYASITRTLAYTVRHGNIEVSHTLSPTDGRITALFAQKLIKPDTTRAEWDQAALYSRRALRDDPTSVTAVAVLGINAQVRGDTVGARRLFNYAQILSRRDIKSQLWAIEDAVSRRDVPDALRHYDIALRTSYTAPDLLFPVLASAISDPEISSSLVKTLVAKPAWGEAFVTYVTVKGPDVRATARFIHELSRSGISVSSKASGELVNLLISVGALDDAWAYYTATRPGADRRRSRDPRFTFSGDPSPFDWAPINDAGISSSIQVDQRGGGFDFAAAATIGGPVLQQRQVLPQGKYKITGHAAGIEQSQEARPYWTLTCADGRELGRVVIPNSSTNSGNFFGHYDVPGSCTLQTLSLIARPSDMVSGSSGHIDFVHLGPAR